MKKELTLTHYGHIVMYLKMDELSSPNYIPMRFLQTLENIFMKFGFAKKR